MDNLCERSEVGALMSTSTAHLCCVMFTIFMHYTPTICTTKVKIFAPPTDDDTDSGRQLHPGYTARPTFSAPARSFAHHCTCARVLYEKGTSISNECVCTAAAYISYLQQQGSRRGTLLQYSTFFCILQFISLPALFCFTFFTSY